MLKYRFMIADGEMPPAAAIQKEWDAFAGLEEASPVPATTKVGAVAKNKKPKTPQETEKK